MSVTLTAPRTLVGALAAVACLGVAVPGAARSAGVTPGEDRIASRLILLDPGARLGGNTQVATVPGARLTGVRGRVNFMLGLAPGQWIMGGAGHDQLGAHGAPGAHIRGGAGPDLIHGGRGHQRLHGGAGHDHIHGGAGHDHIHGGAGNDRIHGGPGRDRLMGGTGSNRIIDRQGATVVVAGPGKNLIDVADGGSDRVLCAAGSVNRIVLDRGDQLARRCQEPLSTVRYARPARLARAALRAPEAVASAINGTGTNDDPYVAECADPQNVVCTTPKFLPRSLTGLWTNEYVPSYKCPPSHPYLYDESYHPAGTALPNGVGVLGLGPIGMSITGIRTTDVTTSLDITSIYTTGTYTGVPNSSATNWTTGTNSYQLQLHCTSDTYYAVFLGYK